MSHKNLIQATLFIICMAGGVLFFAVRVLTPPPLDGHSVQFERRLIHLKQQASPISFPDLVSFDWEKVCFIHPYMLDEDIKQLIGDEYTLGQINTNDDGYYNILFGLPDKHTQAIRVPRQFYQQNTQPCLTYQDSKNTMLHY